MNRKIKLLWDFRGEDASKTAKHHTQHLREFAQVEVLNFYKIDVENKNAMFSSAVITIDEIDLKTYKDKLKPHRGELL